LPENKSLTWNQLKEHLAKDCPDVTIYCNKCQNKFKRKEYVNHPCFQKNVSANVSEFDPGSIAGDQSKKLESKSNPGDISHSNMGADDKMNRGDRSNPLKKVPQSQNDAGISRSQEQGFGSIPGSSSGMNLEGGSASLPGSSNGPNYPSRPGSALWNQKLDTWICSHWPLASNNQEVG
jgi:hypothetical protein